MRNLRIFVVVVFVSYPSFAFGISKAFLGVRLADGAVVEHIFEGSPAEKAGLKTGDTILSLNDKPIGSTKELQDLLTAQEPGQVVKFKLKRGDQDIINTSAKMARHTVKWYLKSKDPPRVPNHSEIRLDRILLSSLGLRHRAVRVVSHSLTLSPTRGSFSRRFVPLMELICYCM